MLFERGFVIGGALRSMIHCGGGGACDSDCDILGIDNGSR